MADCDCPPPGAPAWMATFGDLMSLLLCFFVLLLSFASVDVMKFEGMVGSMKDAFGVKYEDPGMFIALKDSMLSVFDKEHVSDNVSTVEKQLKGKLRKLVKSTQVAGSVEVYSGRDGIIVRMDGDLLFSPGTASISPNSFVFLDEMASVMQQFNHDVSIEGHTDKSAPNRKVYSSNFDLSSRRALSVLDYVVEVGDVDPLRLRVVGFGDTRPVRKNDSIENRNKNRRVEFVFHRVKGGRAGRAL
ncbi:MAG: OmpA family protein [Deltaproteobacteria bacterium]|nr:OmpA family protein [Deltaproteobacteria bacterium]